MSPSIRGGWSGGRPIPSTAPWRTRLDALIHARAPPWYRTPLAQTACLGLIFLNVFAAYTTLQFYARSTYGQALASDLLTGLYTSFTASCLFAPSVVNKLGCRLALTLGILGYAVLVVCSLVFFLESDGGGASGSWSGGERLIVGGGVVLGCGAALLWTAQGRLVLQYAAGGDDSRGDSVYVNGGDDGRENGGGGGRSQTGKLMGVFWAIFQCSSLVGGSISFFYYNSRPSGSASLYVIFLGFILLGAAATQFLLPPSMMCGRGHGGEVAKNAHEVAPGFDDDSIDNVTEASSLISAAGTREAPPLQIERVSCGRDSDDESDAISPNGDISSKTWAGEAAETARLFFTGPMLRLALLFFYTGFNQPYQQATFGNRFFTRRTIGIELIVFHVMEIVGAVVVGGALDGGKGAEVHSDGTVEQGDAAPAKGSNRRLSARWCLLVFVLVNTAGNALAFVQEYAALGPGVVEALDIGDARSLWPSLAFACWGFADSQIQVYCYWLIGALYSSGGEHSRAVGFYKCAQSLGRSAGFYLIPTTRLSPVMQLVVSCVVFLIGTCLSLLELPR